MHKVFLVNIKRYVIQCFNNKQTFQRCKVRFCLIQLYLHLLYFHVKQNFSCSIVCLIQSFRNMSYKQPYDRPYYSSNNMNKYVLANHNRCHLHAEVIKKSISISISLSISDLLNVTLTQYKPNKWNFTGIKYKCSKMNN